MTSARWTKQTREHCRRCNGFGEIFAAHLTNPSDRPKWDECPDCEGSGYQPQKEQEDADHDT